MRNAKRAALNALKLSTMLATILTAAYGALYFLDVAIFWETAAELFSTSVTAMWAVAFPVLWYQNDPEYDINITAAIKKTDFVTLAAYALVFMPVGALQIAGALIIFFVCVKFMGGWGLIPAIVLAGGFVGMLEKMFDPLQIWLEKRERAGK